MPQMSGVELLGKLAEHFGEINAVIVTSFPEMVRFAERKYPVFEKKIGLQEVLAEHLCKYSAQ
ncbi:MAG: hypothetical protein PHC61_00840 [Chitinivibrionales bacterium]|nr:hypothetical protein [Chitinivibrionales bacterium]